MEIALSAASGLVIGLIVGWFGHVLAARRAKEDRAVADATELLDKCGEVMNARVKWVLAYHRRPPNRSEIHEQYLDAKRRYRWADPEVMLTGTPEWEAYMAAERTARLDKTLPLPERLKRVEQAAFGVLDALAERRRKTRTSRGSSPGSP